MRRRLPTVLLIGSLGLIGCGADPKPEARVEPAVVDAPPTIAPALRCEAIEPGEMALSVSPEGDLWLKGPSGLRVLGTNGEIRTVEAVLEGEVDRLVAWSDEVATAMIDGSAWRIEPAGARYLYLPEAVRGASLFCGDLERDGQAALVNAEGIYERAAGQWWALGPEEGERFTEVEWLATVDGACAAPGGGLWFGQGTTFARVDASSIGLFEVPEATGPAVVGDVFGVAVPAGDALLFALERGPDEGWVPVTFTKGDIRSLGGSANVLWALVGNHLYRYDGEWREAEVVLPSGADTLHAHAAGGVWAVGEGEACHIGSAPIRIRGVRPMEHFMVQSTDLVVESETEPMVTVDGGLAVAMEAGEVPGQWVASQLPLGGPGWHEMVVEGESASRRLSYRVMAGDVSWTADVRPIYESHCADAACHGADTEETVDLSTYSAWFERALEIQTAVVTGRMPRERAEGWSSEQVATITDWIDGGMQP